MSDKPYTFRKLNATDVMPMCRILSKVGIKELGACFQSDEVKALISDKSNSADTVGIQVVLDIAGTILERLPDCEKEIFSLLASVGGMTVDDVRALDLPTFAEMVIDFVKKDDFRDFIGVASRLFK